MVKSESQRSLNLVLPENVHIGGIGPETLEEAIGNMLTKMIKFSQLDRRHYLEGKSEFKRRDLLDYGTITFTMGQVRGVDEWIEQYCSRMHVLDYLIICSYHGRAKPFQDKGLNAEVFDFQMTRNPDRVFPSLIFVLDSADLYGVMQRNAFFDLLVNGNTTQTVLEL